MPFGLASSQQCFFLLLIFTLGQQISLSPTTSQLVHFLELFGWMSSVFLCRSFFIRRKWKSGPSIHYYIQQTCFSKSNKKLCTLCYTNCNGVKLPSSPWLRKPCLDLLLFIQEKKVHIWVTKWSIPNKHIQKRGHTMIWVEKHLSMNTHTPENAYFFGKSNMKYKKVYVEKELAKRFRIGCQQLFYQYFKVYSC